MVEDLERFNRCTVYLILFEDSHCIVFSLSVYPLKRIDSSASSKRKKSLIVGTGMFFSKAVKIFLWPGEGATRIKGLVEKVDIRFGIQGKSAYL